MFPEETDYTTVEKSGDQVNFAQLVQCHHFIMENAHKAQISPRTEGN